MSDMDLSGDLRIELEVVQLLRGGKFTEHNALRFYRRNAKGRWVTVERSGPLIAIADDDGLNEFPSRAQLLDAAARIVATHDAEEGL
jgi:hypothetical protein